MSDDLQVVCVSCDPMFSLRAWADAQGYFFPLLSDYWPHGEVTRAFGVLNEATGAPIRGTFLIGRDGVVRWTLVNGPGERRDFGGLPGRGRRTALTHRVVTDLPQCARSADLPGVPAVSGPVAQLVERRVYTAKVVGSIPAGPT